MEGAGTKNMSPILIIGYPRSGSTLLRSIIASHPDVYMVNEPELFRFLFNLGLSASRPVEKKDREIIFKHLNTPDLKSNIHLHINSLPAKYLDGFVENDSLNSFRLVYEYLIGKTGKQFWGEKSLDNSFLIEEIYETFKDVFFIQINRDPRSSIRSRILKKYPKYQGEDGFLEKPPKITEIKLYLRNALILADFSTRWAKYVGSALSKLQKLSKENYCIIKYEDLINDPEKTLELVFNSMGIRYIPGLHSEQNRKNDVISTFDDSQYHTNVSEPLDVSRSEAYNRIASVYQYIIAKYSGEVAKSIGYDFSDINPGYFYRTLNNLVFSKKLRNFYGAIRRGGIKKH